MNLLHYILSEVKNKRLQKTDAIGLIKQHQAQATTNRPRTLHALLHQNTSDLSEQRFSTSLTGEEFFMADHRVQGVRILPSVAQLEMTRAAVQHASSRLPVQTAMLLKNVTFVRPVIVDAHAVQLHIGLYPEENGEIGFDIYSRGAEGESEVIHSQGTVELLETASKDTHDIATLVAQCDRLQVHGTQCYGAFRNVGIEYDASHRALQELHVGQQQVLAKLALPEVVSDTIEQFILHPSLMNGALHASIGLLIQGAGPSSKPILPFALEEVEVMGKCSATMWAVVRYSAGSQPDDKLQKLDIDVCDEYGAVCVRLKGLVFCVWNLAHGYRAALGEKFSGSVNAGHGSDDSEHSREALPGKLVSTSTSRSKPHRTRFMALINEGPRAETYVEAVRQYSEYLAKECCPYTPTGKLHWKSDFNSREILMSYISAEIEKAGNSLTDLSVPGQHHLHASVSEIEAKLKITVDALSRELTELQVYCEPVERNTGIRILSINDEAPISVALFYSTSSASCTMSFGQFTFDTALDGEMPDAFEGLILISHGVAGDKFVHFDLAQRLAKEGFLVAALQHPGDNFFDNSLLSTPSYFAERPRHLTLVLDTLCTHPLLQGKIPMDSIGAIGHSAGGFCVMSLLGAIPDPRKLITHCISNKDDHLLSQIVGNLPVDSLMNTEETDTADYLKLNDDRICAAIVMAPLAALFNEESLKRVTAPLKIYVAEKDGILNGKYHGTWLHKNVPHSAFEEVKGATHGAFMASSNKVAASPASHEEFDQDAFRKRLAEETVAFFLSAFVKNRGQAGTRTR